MRYVPDRKLLSVGCMASATRQAADAETGDERRNGDAQEVQRHQAPDRIDNDRSDPPHLRQQLLIEVGRGLVGDVIHVPEHQSLEQVRREIAHLQRDDHQPDPDGPVVIVPQQVKRRQIGLGENLVGEQQTNYCEEERYRPLERGHDARCQ